MDLETVKHTLEENHLRPEVVLQSLEEGADGSVNITIKLEDGQCTDFTICAEDVARIEQRAR